MNIKVLYRIKLNDAGLLSLTGRSWVEVDGHLYESGRSRWKKVDGPKVAKWTFQKYESLRSKSIKVDGPKVSKLTVQKYHSGRFKSGKVDGPKVLNPSS